MKKLLAIPLLVLLASLWLNAQEALLDQRLDFKVHKVLLKDALFELSLQSSIPLSAPSHLFSDKKISLDVTNESLENILDALIGTQPIAYKVDNAQLIFTKKRVSQKQFTISGYIREQQSGEPLPLATVFDKKSGKGISSNEFGFYSITLPRGSIHLQYSYTGHKSEYKKMNLRKSLTMDILLDASNTLKEILVFPKEKGLNLIDPTTQVISTLRIQQDPSLGGEPDPLRTISQFSGVNTGPDGFGGIYIRGGSMDQNLFLLDGVPVYNPLHLGGLYSIFDDQMIKNIELHKGNAPARYGGRLSSVVDVKMKEGNHHQLRGSTRIGLTAFKGSIEGPLQKGKGSFITAFRQSLINTYLKPISKELKVRRGDSGMSQHSFSDFYTKFNFSVSQKDQLYLSIYKGGDVFKDENKSVREELFTQINQHNQDLDWGNQIIALRWNHLFNDRLFANATFTSSDFHFQSQELYQEEKIQSIQEETEQVEDQLIFSLYNSSISDKAGKIDFSFFPNSQHALRFGAGLIHHTFRPGALAIDQYSTLQANYFQHPDSIASISNTTRSLEYSFYVEDHISFSDRIKVNLGLHTSMLAVEGVQYWSFQPRISTQAKLSDQLVFVSDFGRTAQNLHLLTTSGFGLPSDLWVSATGSVRPQTAWQGSMGLIKSLNKGTFLEISTYQKYLNNLITYKEGANFLTESIVLNASDWESRITSGKGRSYGLEVSLKKEMGRLKYWMNYTWSKSKRQFDDVNAGQVYDFKFDRPHSFKIAANYTFSPKWQLSANWTFQSGLPTTLPTSDYTFHSSNLFTPVTVLNFGQKNSFRLPNFHRLDVECTFFLGKNTGQQVLKIGVYNAYNRKNPLFYRLKEKNDGSGEREFTQVSLLPIVPSISYSYAF